MKMAISSRSLQDGFWEGYQIQEKDIEYLFNHLIEVEEPLTPRELLDCLVKSIIDREKKKIEKQQQSSGKIYLPRDHYEVNDTVTFLSHKWDSGKVVNVRPSFNPNLPPFEVIEVEFPNGKKGLFAAGMENHALNQALNARLDDPALDAGSVIKQYGDGLIIKLKKAFSENPDLVRIAGRWFPKTLLVDVNIGYLNLAEALLDMNEGGPLPISAILDQIDLPTDVNRKLTEFSLNLALQQDERFDEVGPAGEIIWFLNKLEPKAVNNVPQYLKYSGEKYDNPQIGEMLDLFDRHIVDELETNQCTANPDSDETPVCLIYPHWRSGALPLCGNLLNIFPTAREAPRVLFKFVDNATKKEFNGWVVRESNYVYGLEEWYQTNGLIPGNFVYIKKGTHPGEVNIRIDRRKPGREWIRTTSINPNGTIAFTMLKQMVNASYDERMAIYIADNDALDALWTGNRNKNLEKAILSSMLELSKLNPQGHVHAQELYAAVNIIKRCPPGMVFSVLLQSTQISYLGNLYFRVKENVIGTNF
jgi:hypothetical protein